MRNKKNVIECECDLLIMGKKQVMPQCCFLHKDVLAVSWLVLPSQEGVEWGIMLPFTSSCFLILHQRKGDEEFPDSVRRDQALVAKRLMENQGLKEWQEWVTDPGKLSVCLSKRKRKWKAKWSMSTSLWKNNKQNHNSYFFIIFMPTSVCICVHALNNTPLILIPRSSFTGWLWLT